MRLIDADALNARLSRDGTPYFTVPDIYNAPTIDAEPVARCKGCYNAIAIDGAIYCTHWRMNTFEDGYCHAGF